MNTISKSISTPLSLPGAYAAIGALRCSLSHPKNFQKVILHPIKLSFEWVDWARSGLSKSQKCSQILINRVNHLFRWVNFPEKICKVSQTYVKLNESLPEGSLFEIADHSTKLFRGGAKIVGTFANTLHIANREKWIVLSEVLSNLLYFMGGIGCTALILRSLVQIKKRVYELLSNPFAEHKWNFALLGLSGKICSLAKGVFCALAFVIGKEFFAGWLFLGLATLLIVLRISKIFYKKILNNSSKALRSKPPNFS